MLGWDPDSPEEWCCNKQRQEHIICARNRILTLTLDNLGIHGSLPPAFNQLTVLHKLYLANNLLTGSLKTFSNMVHLQTLDVSNNLISGGLAELENVPKLRHLLAGNNDLSGPLGQLLQ